MSTGQRRLAAIMFTDIVGYSALTQRDEAAALAVLDRHNRTLRPVFREHRGREVKTVGDAFLVEFESALDAARCAVDVQRSLREMNATLPSAERIQVRVGVHVGDIVRADGDVLGDAVNIASRVEALAAPGGICVTQQVVDQVQNKLPHPIVRLPPAELKNIRTPVTVYRIVLPWEAPGMTTGAAPRPGGRHLAVLPLANISPDPNDAYFADGLTEELISVLSQVPGLDVIARTSVATYKLHPKSIAEVGAELGVDSILEGSVRKAGRQMRITLQLVDATTQGHVWATSYNRELDDVFAVQADIAERTAEALRLRVGATPPEPRHRRPTENLEAYDAYLHGLVEGTLPEGGGIDRAVASFRRATELDPRFADAYAAWAQLYVTVAGDYRSLQEVMPLARELAARALELDPGSSSAHSALGNLAFQFDLDWTRAEQEFRRALEINPSNVPAHRFLALMLLALDRMDECKDEIREVIRLDPSGSARTTLALAELLDGEFDAAVAITARERDEDPTAAGPHVQHGLFLAGAGRMEDARREAEFPLGPSASEDLRFDHALLEALLGHPEEGRAVLQRVERGENRTYTSATHRALLHSVLGDTGRALDLLEEEYAHGDRTLWLYSRTVFFDPIRKDPRFAALVRRYGLPTDRVRGPPRTKR